MHAWRAWCLGVPGWGGGAALRRRSPRAWGPAGRCSAHQSQQSRKPHEQRGWRGRKPLNQRLGRLLRPLLCTTSICSEARSGGKPGALGSERRGRRPAGRSARAGQPCAPRTSPSGPHSSHWAAPGPAHIEAAISGINARQRTAPLATAHGGRPMRQMSQPATCSLQGAGGQAPAARRHKCWYRQRGGMRQDTGGTRCAAAPEQGARLPVASWRQAGVAAGAGRAEQ